MSRAACLVAGLFALVIPPMAMPSQATFEQLIGDLETVRAEQAVAGFGLAVWSAELGLQSGTGGIADRESGRPVTADTLFRIGSITKTFNALAIMLLDEEGRLDLQAPLCEIVPDVPLDNPWAGAYPVRVAHLLEHSSGLLDMTREEFAHNEPFPTLAAALAWRPQARAVQWPPGLHHVYSNANAGLVGLVIERVSNQEYAGFITERLLRPMGMRSASLGYDEATRRRLATGYDTDGRTPIPYWHMIFPPLGAINAAPQDMGALLELLLRRGLVGKDRLLEAVSIERMERPATTLGARQGLSYGYGLGLDQFLRNGFRWYGHGGDGDGYLSHFAYNRQADAGYFLTINAFNHDALDAMKTRVQDYLTHDLLPPQARRSNSDSDRLSALTGTYVKVTRRFEWQDAARLDEDRVELVLEDDVLYLRSSQGRNQLIAADGNLFRLAGQPVATVAIAAQDGELYLQAEFGNYRRLGDSSK